MAEQKPQRKRRIVVLVDENLHRRARIKSVEANKPLTQVLREALRNWVEDDEEKIEDKCHNEHCPGKCG